MAELPEHVCSIQHLQMDIDNGEPGIAESLPQWVPPQLQEDTQGRETWPCLPALPRGSSRSGLPPTFPGLGQARRVWSWTPRGAAGCCGQPQTRVPVALEKANKNKRGNPWWQVAGILWKKVLFDQLAFIKELFSLLMVNLFWPKNWVAMNLLRGNSVLMEETKNWLRTQHSTFSGVHSK